MPAGRIRLAAASILCVFTKGSGAEIHPGDLLLFFQPVEQFSDQGFPGTTYTRSQPFVILHPEARLCQPPVVLYSRTKFFSVLDDFTAVYAVKLSAFRR